MSAHGINSEWKLSGCTLDAVDRPFGYVARAWTILENRELWWNFLGLGLRESCSGCQSLSRRLISETFGAWSIWANEKQSEVSETEAWPRPVWGASCMETETRQCVCVCFWSWYLQALSRIAWAQGNSMAWQHGQSFHSSCIMIGIVQRIGPCQTNMLPTFDASCLLPEPTWHDWREVFQAQARASGIRHLPANAWLRHTQTVSHVRLK